jgi:YVTN family beta-propeller protein
LAYDSGKSEIFAASGYAKQGFPPVITVISDSDNTIVTTISAASPGNSAYNWPNEPYGLVYDPAKGEIFVSDPSAHSGSVYVISDSTNAVVATVGVGANPNGMVYDSGMGEIFVVNTGSGTISVISDSSNAVVATITVPVAQIAYDSGKNEVFAFGGSGTVSVISDSTNQVVATVTGITSGLTSMAYDSAKGEIFVGDQVISDSSNTIVAQLPTNLNGEAVYDSGKGEVFGVTNVGLSVFSDSSSPSASSASSPTTSPAIASPSPSVPEFGSAGLTLVAAVLMIVTASLVAFAAKRKKQTMR